MAAAVHVMLSDSRPTPSHASAAAVAIGAGSTDICFLLGRRRAVSTRDIGFLLGLRLDLPVVITSRRLGRTSEGDAPHDDAVDVVATERPTPGRPSPRPPL